MNLSDIQVIIFDLDGTLYEDTHHFNYYAKRLQESLPKERRASFFDDYQAVLRGKHPLQIGRIYDAQRDLILVQKKGKVTEAYEWSGVSCSHEQVKRMYSQRITVNLDQMISIGDLWWVPSSIARHYGLNNEQSYAAFLDTREYMMSAAFQMNPVEGLSEAMESWKKKYRMVLMTNSPEPDSEAILQKLELAACFDAKIFEAQKPIETKHHIRDIQQQCKVDYPQILSIGDNLMNEILPARELGCRTILIDPHQMGEKGQADQIVQRIGDLIPILNKCLNFQE